MKLPKDSLNRERFAKLLKVAFGNQRGVAARFLETNEANIGNWEKMANFPRDVEHHLQKLGLPADALGSSDEEWARLLHAARRLVARKSDDVLPDYLYSGGQVQILEEGSAPGDHVILITDDGSNDTQIPEVISMVRENVKRGVSYLYVVPATCPHLPQLRAIIRDLRNELSGDGIATGQVDLLCVSVPGEKGEWRFIDHVLLVYGARLTIGEHAFDNFYLHELRGCYEQLYKRGEVEDGRGYRMWLVSPPRKRYIFIDLLKEWAVNGTWE